MFKRLSQIIRNTDNFIVLVIILVMLNNIEHLAYVHHQIARQAFPTIQLNWWHSIFVVIIIELSIIVLVRKGKNTFAGAYTFMLFVLSLIYYPLPQYWQNAQYGLFIAAIVYSLMFTISIYYFAIMAAEKSSENSLLMNKVRQLDSAASELKQVRAKLEQSEASLKQIDADCKNYKFERAAFESQLQQGGKQVGKLLNELKQVNDELQQLKIYKRQIEAACTCDKCGQQFESEASKRSHAGRCKVKEVKEAA